MYLQSSMKALHGLESGYFCKLACLIFSDFPSDNYATLLTDAFAADIPVQTIHHLDRSKESRGGTYAFLVVYAAYVN